MRSFLLNLNRRDEIIGFLIFAIFTFFSLLYINSKLNSLEESSLSELEESKIYFQEMQLLLLKKEKNQSYGDISSQNSASVISSLARSKNSSDRYYRF